MKITEILESYLECALWVSEEELTENGCEDINIYNIDAESMKDAEQDVQKFLNIAGDAVKDIPFGTLGFDLWLTRNGHGAGFWDRGYDKEISDRLCYAAEQIGSKDVYVGDDGVIYFS